MTIHSSHTVTSDECSRCAGFKAARAERRAERLEELADLGMELARAARGAGCGQAVATEDLATISLAFTRLARAVRLTEALGERLDHPERLAPVARAVDVGAQMDAECADAARRVRGKLTRMLVQARVTEAIEREAAERGDGYDKAGALQALSREIGGTDRLDEFSDTPAREMAVKICAALGVPYDPDLAGEDAAPARSPHAHPSG